MLVHLMLELYGCDRQLLSNEKLIRRVLDEYPARVDMEKVSPRPGNIVSAKRVRGSEPE